MVVALRCLYSSMAENPGEAPPDLTKAWLEKKIRLSADCRRNLVRRIYRKKPLFALAEIRAHCLEYAECQLDLDLTRNSVKTKRKNLSLLQTCAVASFKNRLISCQGLDENDAACHEACNRIVRLQEAHRHRLPIPLSVKLQGRTCNVPVPLEDAGGSGQIICYSSEYGRDDLSPADGTPVRNLQLPIQLLNGLQPEKYDIQQ